MAANEIKVGINVSDNGTTNKAIKSAKELKSAYDEAAKSASRVSSSQGGTQGSRAAMAASARDYTVSRGAASATGASARDFANQAQGLSGLVRLYATYAANVFAVGAAFRALREAAGTEMITRGLEEIGVAGGKNLNSLSRQMVELTGGAISLREAMSSVAKISAAGLSTKQIQDLTTVAAKASNALGVNMEDALNRLTRGVSKLEPELLDELGLFTKIGPATEAYALKLGKSVSALSDFERRQAFANAVLEEGLTKFKNIDAIANPYDKLGASVTNLATQGLNLVNKVLAPIVNLLSESPGALVGIFALIGTSLVKSTLPAIGQLRLGLKYAAEDSLKAAETFKNSFGDRFQDLLEKRFNLDALRQKSKELLGGASESIKRLSQGDMSMETTVNKMLADRNQKLAEADAGLIKLTRSQREKIRLDILQIQAAKELGAAEKAAQAIADKSLGKWDPERLAAEKYYTLRLKGTKDSIVATAAEDAQIIGLRGSMVLLHQEVEKNGLKSWDKWSTIARGAIGAVLSRVGQILGSLGYIGQAVGIAVGTFELLDAVFSKNSKELQKVSSATEAVNEQLKFTDKVLKSISDKNPLEKLSPATMQQASNAIKTLSDNTSDLVQSIEDAAKSANAWDRFIDGWKTLWGGDILSKGSEGVARSIQKGFSLILDGEVAAAANETFKEAFGVDASNQQAIEQLLKKDPETFLRLAPEMAAKWKEITDRIQASAGASKDLVDSFEVAVKSLEEFNASMLPTDKVAKFGLDLINLADKFSNLLTNSIVSGTDKISATVAVLKDDKKLGIIGKEASKNLISIRDAVITAAGTATRTAGDVALLNLATKELSSALEKSRTEGIKLIENSILQAFAKGAIILQQAFANLMGDTVAGTKYRAELEKKSIDLQIAQLNDQKKLVDRQDSMARAVEEQKLMTMENTLALERNTLALTDPKALEKSQNIAEKQKALDLRREAFAKPQDSTLQNLAKKSLDSQIAQLTAQKKAIDIATASKLLEIDSRRKAEQIEYSKNVEETESKKLANSIKGLEFLSEATLKEKQRLETEQRSLEQLKERSALQLEINKQFSILQSPLASKESKAAAIAALQEYGKQMNLLQNTQEEKNKQLLDDQQAEVLDNNKKQEAFYNKLEQLRLDTEAAVIKYASELRDEYFNQYKTTGAISARAVVEEEFRLRALKEKEASDLSIKSMQKERDDRIALLTTNLSNAPEADRPAIQQEIDALRSKYREQIDGEYALRQAKEKTLVIDKQLAVLNAEQKIRSDELAKSIEYMATAFDNFGESAKRFADGLAGTMTAINNAKDSQEKYALKQIQLEKQLESAKSSGKENDVLEIEKQIAKTRQDAATSELVNTSKIISSSKKMFNEKTTAYKVLNGLERANNILIMANQAQQLMTTISSISKLISSYIPGIYASFSAWLGPFGPAAATAVIAATIGSAFGRGSSTPSFQMSSEQLQETQGTGSTYVDSGDGTGRLVATGGGVFGDIKAKSQSIDKTLSRMEANQVDGLDQDSRLYRAFKDLDKSIVEVAKTLPSFQTSPFGTGEGTTSSSFLFGLSSSTSTQEIISSGIKLQGTFFELMKATNDLVKIAEKVKTTTTDTFLWIFDSIDVSIKENFKDLSPRQLKAISSSFTAGAEALSSVAELVGVDQTSVLNKLKNLPVDALIDLKGKTGQEFVDEFNAVIGGYLDEAATSLFTSFEAFRALGEGMLETVTRVIDTNAKIAQGLKNIGSATPDLTGDYKITEAIASSAGGIDKAVSQYNFFTENFLTDTEKLAISQSSVDKVFTKLGITSIKTKSQFASLVKGLDLTTERGRLTYQTLQDIAPQFLEVANSVESGLSKTVDSFKNFAQNIQDFRNSLLIGSLSPLTPGQKYLQAKRIAEETYTAALGGDITAQGKLTQVASDFLEASRGYYASSEQYTIDFNYVVEALNAAEKVAKDTMTDAQKQLKETETQTEVLKDILSAINTPTAADLTSTASDTTLVEQGIQTVDALAKELKNAGAITEEQYQSTSSGLRDAAAGSNLSNEQWAAIIALRNEEGFFKNEFDSNTLKGLAGIIAGSLVSGPVSTIVGEVVKAATGTESIAGFTTTYGYFAKAIDAVNRKVVETYSEEARSASESIQDYYEGWDPNDIAMEIGTAAGQALSEGINSGAIAIPINLDNNITYTDTFATGGYASGLSIVGELGPELVDFKTPGRVYTAEQTFGMFNGNSSSNGELIQEIRELRKEVATLRQQQHEETMVLVEATYDSQDQNANKLASTITNSNWNAKLQQSVKLR